MLVRPDTLAEALEELARHGTDAHVLAGGQSLIPMMSAGLLRPSALIDVGRLAAPEPVGLDGREVVVRLGCTHRQLEHPGPDLEAAAPVVAPAASYVANPAVRNRGTVLGSLAHADPAGEWPAVATAVEARLELASTRGTRVVPIDEFMLGPLFTVTEPDEIVTEARWPAWPQGPGLWSGAAVQELAYRHGDYAVVGAVVLLTVDRERLVRSSRIVVFALGDAPTRLTQIEAALVGHGPEAFGDAGAAAAQGVEAISDATASAAYRERMAGVMVRRGLEAAFAYATTRDEQ